MLTPFNPDHFINSLVVHKTNTFNTMDVGIYGNGKQTVKKGKHYGLKIYDKGLQNAKFTSDNILRFEVKCLKMELISTGPIYLSDLLNPPTIDRCQVLLKAAFDDLVISEPVNLKDLSNKEREFLLRCVNPNYWNTLSRSKRCRDKIKYTELLQQFSTDRLKDKTFTILTKTLRELTAGYKKNRNVLTGIVKAVMQRSDRLGKLSKRCITENPMMNCLSCGRDISTQKKGSRFCSEKIFGKQGKKCRNMGANPRNNLKRKVHYLQKQSEGQMTFFDIQEYMKIPEGIELKITDQIIIK